MAFFLSVIMSVVDRLRTVPSHPSSFGTDSGDYRAHDDVQDESNDKYRVKSKCCFLVNMSWMSRFVGSVLRWSSVPRHIGLILDGNRRFAVKRHLARKSLGHSLGFEKLHETLEWCFDAGVRAVTVYAFSIDNFRRPEEEVQTLFALAQEKFEYMLNRSALMRKNSVVIRVWGNLSLLPETLRLLVLRVMEETRNNSGPALNICFPYTSTHEVVMATQSLASASGGCARRVEASEFDRALFSQGDHPELLVRTSGEARLSDFLCWQTGHAHFLVYKCLWPEFSLLHFVVAILMFRFHKMLEKHNK
jgi:ditrans,polycis-polyprenyl diphosphate synthase